MAVGWAHIPTFQNSSSGTDAPGMPGPLGSRTGRFLSCPPSILLFQPICPQKPASSSPNISRSRASARGRHIMGHRRNRFQIAHFCKDFLPFFWPCLNHLMLLSLDYFLSCFLSFSPYSLDFLPLPLFLPLLSLLCAVWPTAFITAAFTSPFLVRAGMTWILCLCQALHLLERGRKKRKKKATKPWKFARRQYLGRDYSGCSKWSLLYCSQSLGRANVTSQLLPPTPACCVGFALGREAQRDEISFPLL